MTRQTLTVDELSAALSVSPWTLYEAIRRGDSPVQPIRVGRRIIFAKAAVEQLLGPIEAGP